MLLLLLAALDAAATLLPQNVLTQHFFALPFLNLR
jgi:hypothetical protein